MKYSLDIDPRISFNEVKSSVNLPAFVSFSGDVSEASAAKFRSDLANAENLAKLSQQSVIPVIIDSYGGEVHACLSMVDAMRACSVPLATIVEGKAMSAGAIMFTCGAEGHRYVGHNATVMFHDVSSWQAGKLEDLRTSFHHSEYLNEVIFQIASENCGHDPEYFQRLLEEHMNQDIFFNANECIEHNIASHIGIPRFDIKMSLDVDFILPEQNNKVPKISTVAKVKKSKNKNKQTKSPAKKVTKKKTKK